MNREYSGAAQIWINPRPALHLGNPASFEGDKTYDLQTVLTHELGQVLGLGEADEAPDATMFPSSSAEKPTSVRSLTKTKTS